MGEGLRFFLCGWASFLCFLEMAVTLTNPTFECNYGCLCVMLGSI